MADRKRTLRFLVIAGGLALFVLVVFWLSRRGPLFTPTYLLKVEFDSVAGLDRQSKVLMRGFPVGQVHGISLVPGGIVVTIDLEKKYRVPAGSSAAIENISLLGERAIDITPSEAAEELPPGALLRGVNRDFMAELKAALKDLAPARGEFDWNRLGRTLDLVEKTFGTLERELSRMDLGRVSAELKDAVQAAREIRDDIRQSSERFGELSEQGRSALARFEQALDSAERTQAAFDRYLSRVTAESERAANLMNDREFAATFKSVLSQLDDFLRDLKKNPKKYFRFSLF
jgi:phospholipid/cholesterol/gamma-HCH transport system substrate-binding protein